MNAQKDSKEQKVLDFLSEKTTQKHALQKNHKVFFETAEFFLTLISPLGLLLGFWSLLWCVMGEGPLSWTVALMVAPLLLFWVKVKVVKRTPASAEKRKKCLDLMKKCLDKSSVQKTSGVLFMDLHKGYFDTLFNLLSDFHRNKEEADKIDLLRQEVAGGHQKEKTKDEGDDRLLSVNSPDTSPAPEKILVRQNETLPS